MTYQIGENIPFSVILLRSNGNPKTGKNCELTVFDDTTGLKVLDEQAMTEDQPGYYRYTLDTSLMLTSKTLTFYCFESGANKVRNSGTIRLVKVRDDINAETQLQISVAKLEILGAVENALIILNENIDDSDGRVS